MKSRTKYISKAVNGDTYPFLRSYHLSQNHLDIINDISTKYNLKSCDVVRFSIETLARSRKARGFLNQLARAQEPIVIDPKDFELMVDK